MAPAMVAEINEAPYQASPEISVESRGDATAIKDHSAVDPNLFGEDDTDPEDETGAESKGKDVSQKRQAQNRKFAAW